MYTLLTRNYYFRAIHFLDSVCDPAGNSILHGHDYDLEITINAEPDPASGLAFSPDKMNAIVDQTLVQPYDKTNLNDHFPVTSGEELANHFFRLLKQTDLGPALHRVALQETRKNRFISCRTQTPGKETN